MSLFLLSSPCCYSPGNSSLIQEGSTLALSGPASAWQEPHTTSDACSCLLPVPFHPQGLQFVVQVCHSSLTVSLIVRVSVRNFARYSCKCRLLILTQEGLCHAGLGLIHYFPLCSTYTYSEVSYKFPTSSCNV